MNFKIISLDLWVSWSSLIHTRLLPWMCKCCHFIPAWIIIIIILRSLAEVEAGQLFNWDSKWCKRNSWETKRCPCILKFHSHPEKPDAFARTSAHTWTSIRWAGCRGWNRIRCWKKKITSLGSRESSSADRHQQVRLRESPRCTKEFPYYSWQVTEILLG